MTASIPNPYAAPANLPDDSAPALPPRRVSWWLAVSLALSLVGYAGMTLLLLFSTSMDRFFGYFYLPVLFLLAILNITVHFNWSQVRLLALATAISQCCLASWLTWIHQFHTPSYFLAVLPTIIIVSLSLTCVAIASRPRA